MLAASPTPPASGIPSMMSAIASPRAAVSLRPGGMRPSGLTCRAPCLLGARKAGSAARVGRAGPLGRPSARVRHAGPVRMSLETPKGDDLFDQDLLKPKFNREPFSEHFVDEKVVTERQGRTRKRRASPREAYLGSVVILCTSAISYLIMNKALGVVSMLPDDVVAAAATKPVAEAMVLGTGTLACSMFALNAIGLFLFGVQQQARAGEPIVYYRCDGSDPKCCVGSPGISYLSNYRGYETSARRKMDRHLKKRSCKEVEPLIVFPDRDLARQDADLN